MTLCVVHSGIQGLANPRMIQSKQVETPPLGKTPRATADRAISNVLAAGFPQQGLGLIQVLAQYKDIRIERHAFRHLERRGKPTDDHIPKRSQIRKVHGPSIVRTLFSNHGPRTAGRRTGAPQTHLEKALSLFRLHATKYSGPILHVEENACHTRFAFCAVRAERLVIGPQ
jgi:hypothetical protein